MSTKELLPTEALAAELAAQKSSKGRQRIYKEISDEHKAELIGADVRRTAQALTKNNGRVDLSDLETVKERTQIYLEACADSGTVPNVLGLASFGFGCSRQWLNEYMRLHPNSQSTEYLEMVKDAFANVLINAGLGRASDPTLSIFILKNTAGFRDRFEIEPVTTKAPPMGELVDIAELEAKVMADVIVDEFDD